VLPGPSSEVAGDEVDLVVTRMPIAEPEQSQCEVVLASVERADHPTQTADGRTTQERHQVHCPPPSGPECSSSSSTCASLLVTVSGRPHLGKPQPGHARGTKVREGAGVSR